MIKIVHFQQGHDAFLHRPMKNPCKDPGGVCRVPGTRVLSARTRRRSSSKSDPYSRPSEDCTALSPREETCSASVYMDAHGVQGHAFGDARRRTAKRLREIVAEILASETSVEKSAG